MRVDILDGNDMMEGRGETVIAANVWLVDCLEDAAERADVEREVQSSGRAWIGGGAAAFFYIRRAEAR